MSKHAIIKESPIHGKGVFASRNIKSGETIATCHVLLLSHHEELPESIATLQFPWSDDFYALCISSIGSFFNHNKDASAKVTAQNPETETQDFIATRNIEEGEEITIFYNQEFEDYIQ
ncbi:MAG: SET domain-containing protein-lysine N-methyltransferase [Flavobacteriales bacterium]|nr:SET domain-containing protein-lysine N-methyltransferase [Flavobacteriales bacterium]